MLKKIERGKVILKLLLGKLVKDDAGQVLWELEELERVYRLMISWRMSEVVFVVPQLFCKKNQCKNLTFFQSRILTSYAVIK